MIVILREETNIVFSSLKEKILMKENIYSSTEILPFECLTRVRHLCPNNINTFNFVQKKA